MHPVRGDNSGSTEYYQWPRHIWASPSTLFGLAELSDVLLRRPSGKELAALNYLPDYEPCAGPDPKLSEIRRPSGRVSRGRFTSQHGQIEIVLGLRRYLETGMKFELPSRAY